MTPDLVCSCVIRNGKRSCRLQGWYAERQHAHRHQRFDDEYVEATVRALEPICRIRALASDAAGKGE
jgi:hypothetical protein